LGIIAQLFVVVEKLSFLESVIFLFFLPHSYINQSQINGGAWMGLNFDDYSDFQLKITHTSAVLHLI
jgi:hypothetical protein